MFLVWSILIQKNWCQTLCLAWTRFSQKEAKETKSLLSLTGFHHWYKIFRRQFWLMIFWAIFKRKGILKSNNQMNESVIINSNIQTLFRKIKLVNFCSTFILRIRWNTNEIRTIGAFRKNTGITSRSFKAACF